MTYKSNDFGAFSFFHLPTATMYELYSRDRYDANINVYATAWRVNHGLTHAVQVESFDKLLVTDVPRRGLTAELALGDALNICASHVANRTTPAPVDAPGFILVE